MNKFDVIVMVTEEHLSMFRKMLPYCKNNINPRRIFAVANKRIEKEICNINNVEYIDEESIYEGLNYNKIQNIIRERTGKDTRAGWYLQQFLKLAWAYRCEDDYYVVLDADTFILNPIQFINDNKYLFTAKMEYHEPYFNTLNNLFDGRIKRVVDFSFIAENMIFDCNVVKEMLSDIENNIKLKGNNFYEKIMYAISTDDILGSGFSEFETYGNYIYTNKRDSVNSRKLRTMRESLVLLGGEPTVEQLRWASNDYDVISIESKYYKKTLVTVLTKQEWFRSFVSMRKLARFRHKIRTLYRKLIGKEDFVIESYE